MAGEPCRLYLISPPALDPAAFADTLAGALDAGDVGAVQLRLKDADDQSKKRGDVHVPSPRVNPRPRQGAGRFEISKTLFLHGINEFAY